MSNINEMFSATENGTAAVSNRGLAGTAQLVSVSNSLVASTITTLNDNFAQYKEIFEASKADHNSMDKLLSQLINFAEVDVEFLKALPEDATEGMLKSQQSKRSRSKGKVMTMDNYKAMMSAAIAENLIRTATGKAKSSGGARRTAGSVVYSEERLEELAADQEQLKKELRNVQSKKSIMKTKADFSEESEHWQELLVAEAQLKGIRVVRERVVKVDETKNLLESKLEGIDFEHLKANDSKALLAQIAELIGK